MPASFPSSAKSFVTREIGDTIAASHINDLQLEVAAIESDLLNATPTFLSTVTSGINATALSTGTVPLARLDANVILTTSTTGINATALSTGTVPLARLASANTTANGIVDTTTQSFAGGKTFSGVMTITGAATLSNTLGVTGATTLSSTLAVTGATTLTGGLNTPLVPAQGGTGLSSYAVGDLVYASGSTTLAKLADVAVGQVLVSGGVATAPAYSASPSITSLTYTTSLNSITALATPSALTATQATAFASTVSGAAIMGFGTTNDVSLMNRAGTVVLGIGPNTTAVNMAGALSVSGAISSATSVALTGTTNNVGTITTGVWNAGAVTSSGPFSLTGGSSASFAVGGTSAVLLDNSGNYNILSLNNSASLSAGVGLGGGASGDAASLYHLAASGGLHYFRVNGTDYMTLSSAGLLAVSGFGVHSFSAGGATANTVRITNTTSGAAAYSELSLFAGTNQFYIQTLSQGWTTAGYAVASGTILESVAAGGLSIAASNASGTIRFYAGGTTERMNISTGGIVNLAGGTNAVNQTGISLDGSSGFGDFSRSAGPAMRINRYTSTGEMLRFAYVGSTVGSISTDGSNTAYNTSSDARLKRSLGIASHTDVLHETVIRDFEWLANGVKSRGVFAQEAYTVAPFAVMVGSDEIKDGHLANPWGVDYSKYVPDLIVGWQQHDATIQQLAARIAALETKDN